MNNAQRERSIREDTSLLGHNAFMGSASLSLADATLRVHAMCWPIVPTAWRSMAQAWESIGGWRDELDTIAKAQSPSWIADCAAQLGSPFRGTSAEESTVAAILTRTPMYVAISVLDGGEGDGAIQRESLLNCLSSYDKYITVPGRRPCRILVSRSLGKATDRGHIDAFARSRQRLPDAQWLHDMELCCWSDPIEPLPLEAAHVIAASIARYRADDDRANPIADAVRAKLAHPLELLDRPPKRRR